MATRVSRVQLSKVYNPLFTHKFNFMLNLRCELDPWWFLHGSHNSSLYFIFSRLLVQLFLLFVLATQRNLFYLSWRYFCRVFQIQHETHEYKSCMIQINTRIYWSSVFVLHFHLLAPVGLVYPYYISIY